MNSAGGSSDANGTAVEGRRLLVVDDDQVFRIVLRDTLTEEGYTVLVAADGREAIDVLARKPIDLILLDIVMPGIDGLTVLRRVKRFMPSIKVVVVTAYIEPLLVEEAKRLGADDFIGKPYMLPDLLEAIERVLLPLPEEPTEKLAVSTKPDISTAYNFGLVSEAP
jgi:CheY-like chemotaxis protein